MKKNITIGILAVVALYLFFQVRNLNNRVDELRSVCGDACENLFVTFNIPGLANAVDAVGADRAEVKACLDTGQMTARVNRDFDTAQRLGLTGTPANFLLNNETGLGVLIPGAYPFEILQIAKGALLNPEAKAGDVVYSDESNRISLSIAEFPDLDPITQEDNIKGAENAKIALVEYSDFDCPFCKNFHSIAEQFVTQNDDVEWVLRHYPIRSIHPTAQKKAEAAECVAEIYGQERFWQFTNSLYALLQN